MSNSSIQETISKHSKSGEPTPSAGKVFRARQNEVFFPLIGRKSGARQFFVAES